MPFCRRKRHRETGFAPALRRPGFCRNLIDRLLSRGFFIDCIDEVNMCGSGGPTAEKVASRHGRFWVSDGARRGDADIACEFRGRNGGAQRDRTTGRTCVMAVGCEPRAPAGNHRAAGYCAWVIVRAATGRMATGRGGAMGTSRPTATGHERGARGAHGEGCEVRSHAPRRGAAARLF